MRKHLIGFCLSLALLSGFLLSQAVVACTTQTLIVDGKVTVCTVCGTVISCMYGEPHEKSILRSSSFRAQGFALRC